MSSLGQEALSSWRVNAEFWDAGVGAHGNKYWQRLQRPSLERLLGATFHTSRHSRALDLATGNGLCARWMAAKGFSTVIATDGCDEMLDMARKYRAEAPGVTFAKLDVTSERDFDAFLEGECFDVIVINMAIMDIPTIEPLAKAVPRLLKRHGVFVATMLHPAFFTSTQSKNVHVSFDPASGEQEIVRSKTVTEYLHVKPAKGVAVVGQPAKQIYFHRPLHEILGTFFRAGLVLDAMEEPNFTEEDAVPERLEATANFV